jgi:hypothetical protein
MQVRANWKALAVFLCLGVTQPGEVRADNSHWRDTGLTARAGTSVGFSDIADYRFATLGGQMGLGYRLGAVALEGEYDATQILRYNGHSNDLRGEMRRLGAAGRLYFARIGRLSGGSSHFLLFGDVAIGRQKGLLKGQSFARNDIGAGGGWLLDHAMDRRSASGIERVGWHFGWRLTASQRAPEAMARVVCGKQCPDLMPPARGADLNLSVSSSLSLSW